ncbi:MAG: TlpA family protein disulfide reductase [Nitrospinae bacterium]|nr:TlpA family protein disulfide reductase [Nitrospinota bacterium]
MPAVNEKAPDLEVAEWIGEAPGGIDRQCGRVVLVEVFQVNCPGCFIGGLPEAIGVYNKYKDRGLTVWGLATAFEDFDKNNLGNLKKLLSTGEVVGETLAYLSGQNILDGNRLQYRIPFPVAWDRIVQNDGIVREEEVEKIIRRDIAHFALLSAREQELLRGEVGNYLKRKPYNTLTFDAYELRGTPSSILIDKKGILRYKLFGFGQGLETRVKTLLDEEL